MSQSTLKLWKPTCINMYITFPYLHSYLTSPKNDKVYGEEVSESSQVTALDGLDKQVSTSDTPSSSNVIPLHRR